MRQVELKLLNKVLAEQPRLNKDRLTIDRGALAKATRITQSRLGKDPFAALLIAWEADLLAAAKASRIEPYAQGRFFVFSDLMPPWSSRLLKKVLLLG